MKVEKHASYEIGILYVINNATFILFLNKDVQILSINLFKQHIRKKAFFPILSSMQAVLNFLIS